jgi:hypothetical protein
MSNAGIAVQEGQVWDVPSKWRPSGRIHVKIAHIFDDSIYFQSECGDPYPPGTWTPPYPEIKEKFINILQSSGELITTEESDESEPQTDVFVDGSIPDDELHIRTKGGETIGIIKNLKMT